MGFIIPMIIISVTYSQSIRETLNLAESFTLDNLLKSCFVNF